jgi:hypothetical protein
MSAVDKNMLALCNWLLEAWAQAQRNRDVMGDWVTGAGFEWLGGGYYSNVYRHPSVPGRVFKMTLCSEDEASITYLAWARANPGRHVPTVYHLERAPDIQLSVINELYPLDTSNHYYFDAYLDGYTADSYALAVAAAREQGAETGPVETALEICRFFKGLTGWDLHSGNAMQDKDGVIVITDPVTRANDKDTRTLLTGVERAFNVKSTQHKAA